MATRSTSKAAKTSILPVSGTQQAALLDFLKGQGACGATLEEMEWHLSLSGNTVRPRRRELEEQGLVKDSGFTRHTESGRSAIVWVVTEKAVH